MLRKGTILLAVILGWTILSGVAAPAQDTQTSPKAAAQPDSSAEDGKKINSRQYSMNLATNDGNEIKIGTRIPVESKEGEFQYLDVGTSLFARIGETRGQSELTVRAEISNFAMPESSLEKHESRPDLHPIIRQLKMGGSVLMPLPKTIVIGSADDPNSKREFQLEVTVTKLR
jgi:hypothetical protein